MVLWYDIYYGMKAFHQFLNHSIINHYLASQDSYIWGVSNSLKKMWADTSV